MEDSCLAQNSSMSWAMWYRTNSKVEYELCVYPPLVGLKSYIRLIGLKTSLVKLKLCHKHLNFDLNFCWLVFVQFFALAMKTIDSFQKIRTRLKHNFNETQKKLKKIENITFPLPIYLHPIHFEHKKWRRKTDKRTMNAWFLILNKYELSIGWFFFFSKCYWFIYKYIAPFTNWMCVSVCFCVCLYLSIPHTLLILLSINIFFCHSSSCLHLPSSIHSVFLYIRLCVC